MIVVCCECFRMKNKDGVWVDVGYVKEDTHTLNHSHGICEECTKKLYPWFKE